MSFSDIDHSSQAQEDLWWRIEELDEYSRRRDNGDLDIVRYLAELPASDPASTEDRAQVAFAFEGEAGRRRFMVAQLGDAWARD